jgi:hypothetical protein
MLKSSKKDFIIYVLYSIVIMYSTVFLIDLILIIGRLIVGMF